MMVLRTPLQQIATTHPLQQIATTHQRIGGTRRMYWTMCICSSMAGRSEHTMLDTLQQSLIRVSGALGWFRKKVFLCRPALLLVLNAVKVVFAVSVYLHI